MRLLLLLFHAEIESLDEETGVQMVEQEFVFRAVIE